jgi:hypothetical protein
MIARSIKVLQTTYNGYRFRSRTEARWAVFFDAAGIAYEYEKEGFTLPDGSMYLPDFWLPRIGFWVEVKGSDPTEVEIERCRMLQTLGGEGDDEWFVALVVGPPTMEDDTVLQIGPYGNLPRCPRFVWTQMTPRADVAVVERAVARFEFGERPSVEVRYG